MKNIKGFTLIELLATLVILSIIMLVAIPSTVSVLDKNKKDTYISDAKRLVALAESEIRNNDKLDVEYNGIIVFPFSELNDGSFKKDPDSTLYSPKLSFVIAHKKGTVEDYQFVYYVQLFGVKRGVPFTTIKSVDRNTVTGVTNTSFDISNIENLKTFLAGGKIDGFTSTSTNIVYYSSN